MMSLATPHARHNHRTMMAELARLAASRVKTLLRNRDEGGWPDRRSNGLEDASSPFIGCWSIRSKRQRKRGRESRDTGSTAPFGGRGGGESHQTVVSGRELVEAGFIRR